MALPDADCTLDDAHELIGGRLSEGGRRWQWRWAGDDVAIARIGMAIAQQFGIDELIARIMAARGIKPTDVDLFLTPRLRTCLPNPNSLADMPAVVNLLATAVEQKACIGIFGDYDVDGACATSLLIETLSALGGRTLYHIPDRLKEGYGPNQEALERLISQGAALIVCVDCGTTSAEILDVVRERVPVIVLDHHKPGNTPLPRALIVNPHRIDCTSGLTEICATTLVFLTLIALLKEMEARRYFVASERPNLLSLLDLVALATICDVMPLRGFNRVLVSQGLRVLKTGARTGLVALAETAKIQDLGDADGCGFALGPRINAGGRVAQADLGVRLLTSKTQEEARDLAHQLNSANEERRSLETTCLAFARGQAERQLADGHAVVFVYHSDFHPGVVGIVAGRLKEQFNRPVLVGALRGGMITGSARAISGVDIGAALLHARAEGLIVSGGGHAAAAGFSLAMDHVEHLHAFLDARFEAIRAWPSQGPLFCDGMLPLSGISLGVARQLQALAPFGTGNAEPVFIIPRVRCVQATRIGRDAQTLRVVLQDEYGAKVKAIVFRVDTKPFGRTLEDRTQPLLSVAGNVRCESWQNRESVTLFICDVALN